MSDDFRGELVFRAAVSVSVYRPRCFAHVLLFILTLHHTSYMLCRSK